MTDSPVLIQHRLDGRGGVSADGIIEWVHLNVDHLSVRDWFRENAPDLDELTVEALLADETRPRMVEHRDCALLFLRGVNLNADSAPEDMVSVRLFLGPNRIISLRKRQLKGVLDVQARLLDGRGPVSVGDFVAKLLGSLFDRMEPTLSLLDETTDTLEEALLEGADSTLREAIVGVRKQAIVFRRYLAPQRDAIASLRTAEVSWLDEHNRRQLMECYQQMMRFVEDLDALRERAQIVKDELQNVLADKLNRNMYVLSVVAAVFLPLGFLTGLLGINVGGVPGVENPYAFEIFCAFSVALVALQVWLFKRWKWF